MARQKLYVWLIPCLAGVILLVIISVLLLPFANSVRLNAERYQSLLAEKIAGDINFLFYDSNRLRRYLSGVKIGENGFIYIIDQFGRFIFYSPNFPIVREKSLGVVVPVGPVSRGWRMVVGVPLSEALAEQYAALSVAFLMFLAALLFVILLFIVIKKLARGDHRKPLHLLLRKARAPLASVKWNLHALLAGDWGPMNDRQRKFLERGLDANQRMIKLADQLADSAALEAGGGDFQFVKDDVVDLVKKIAEEFKAEAQKADIRIVFNEPPKTLPLIPMDTKKIKLALVNILDNAIRYNLPGGRVVIKIFKERGMVIVKFSDTGIGIPADQRTGLFGKFFRTTKAVQAQPAGFGLDLYIAKLIVDGHGGKILVESREHEGSTFSVFLPI